MDKYYVTQSVIKANTHRNEQFIRSVGFVLADLETGIETAMTKEEAKSLIIEYGAENAIVAPAGFNTKKVAVSYVQIKKDLGYHSLDSAEMMMHYEDVIYDKSIEKSEEFYRIGS